MSKIIIPKRQATFRTVIKNTKKNGASIEIHWYSSAVQNQSDEDRKQHVHSEGFVMENGTKITLLEIANTISESIANLAKEKGADQDIPISRHVIMQE